MSINRIVAATTLSCCGVLMWVWHMSLVHTAVGKFRTRLGLFFGINRLDFFILGIKIAAVLLILSGFLMAASNFRKAKIWKDEKINT